MCGNCMNISIVPLMMHAYVCYRCFVETFWLEKYWVGVLVLHATLSIITIAMWTFGEYRMLLDTKAQTHSRRYQTIFNEEDAAAILQNATRRKLAKRSNITNDKKDTNLQW